MPKLDEIATSVELGDGESAVVTWNPSSVVDVEAGSFGSPVHVFYVTLEDDTMGKISGGSRLVKAWKGAKNEAPKGAKSLKLRVTAHGQPRTTERTWEVNLL